MPANTYTWTCPACRYQAVSTNPAPPANCPRCNYPDAKADANADLEADEPEDEAEPVASATAPTNAWQPIHQIDWGWLAECLTEAFSGQTMREPPPDIAGLMEEVRQRYEAPRPTLLCGCLAGRHPNTFAAMQEAHPERVSGS